MSAAMTTVLLLVISNVFMTFAWYGHLRLGELGISKSWPLIAVIFFSWGIALFEYMCQVPANRIGFEGNGGPYNLMQLKVMQEVITLVVFVIFCTLAFDNFHIRWNHYLAGLLLIAAVYLVFMK